MNPGPDPERFQAEPGVYRDVPGEPRFPHEIFRAAGVSRGSREDKQLAIDRWLREHQPCDQLRVALEAGGWLPKE